MQTALIGVLDDVMWAIEQRMVTNSVLFEFSKAFDCIIHKLLLIKLQTMGITGTPLRWFFNYLQSRQQAVRITRARHSSYKPIASGISQGSVLGPIMCGSFSSDLSRVLYIANSECSQMIPRCTSTLFPINWTTL